MATLLLGSAFFGFKFIFVPKGCASFDQHQESRPLGRSNTGSSRFTDFPSNMTNLIGWEYDSNTLRTLKNSGPASILGTGQKERNLFPEKRFWRTIRCNRATMIKHFDLHSTRKLIHRLLLFEAKSRFCRDMSKLIWKSWMGEGLYIRERVYILFQNFGLKPTICVLIELELLRFFMRVVASIVLFDSG